MRQHQLDTLQTYTFPPTFAPRLAHEQGWTLAHTERVLAEYRRFLILAATAGQPVTPSKAVDEAWHLHLTYTRDYWERLCAQVLDQPLHHQPADGSAAGAQQHRDQYTRTLDLYARTFLAPAPADLWPDPRRMPQQPTQPSAKLGLTPTAPQPRMVAALAVALLGLLAWGLSGLGWLAVAGVVLALLLAGASARARSGRGSGDGANTSDGFSGFFTWDGGGSDGCGDSGGPDGGGSCGSGCGGGCGS